jgi:hypothetical protein
MATEQEKQETKHLTPKDALNKKLNDITRRGMAITKEWVSMWCESLRYFFGDQLHHKKRHKDWEWVVLNYIWPSAFQEIAKLSRNNPKIIASPWRDDDTDAAQAWQAELQWDWRKGINGHGMRLEQIAAILDGKLFGYRVSKVFWEGRVEWDDAQKQWVGDVKHKLWHPAQFWADGGETVNDGNCGTERYVALEWAQSRWPKFAKELERESQRHQETMVDGWGGPNIRGQLSGSGYTSGAGGSDPGTDSRGVSRLLNLIVQEDKMTKSTKDEEIKVPLVKIEEIYYRDYEEVNQKEEQPVPVDDLVMAGLVYQDQGIPYDTKTNKPFPSKPEDWPSQTIRQWKEPKYPYGRHIIRCGDTILNPRRVPTPCSCTSPVRI